MLSMLSGVRKYVYPLDPSIDYDNWDEKEKTNYFIGGDDKLPPCKAGERLTMWHIKPLTGVQMKYANGIMGESRDDVKKALNNSDFIEFVVSHGLVKIDNLDIGGVVLNKEDGPYGEHLTTESCDSIFPFYPVLEQHLAMMILSLSRLQFGA